MPEDRDLPDANPIRVLAILEAYTISGSAKAVLEFAQEARQPGQRPCIDLSIAVFSRFQDETSLTTAVRNAGIPLDIISERSRFDRAVIPQLQSIVSARRPDIVWSNSVKSHFLIRWAGVNRRVKWVAFHHGYTATNLKMRLYNQLDRWSLPVADRVLTVCRPFARELQLRGVSPDRMSVQHMPIRPFEGVSPEAVDRFRAGLGLGPDARVFLNIGRLSREKGHADLIRAFALVRERNPVLNARLVLVGEGPERRNIEALCASLGVSSAVTLTGQQDDVKPYYAIADVFVLPSHSEGSPNVLLEAMAAGVPVVATSVGGVPELAVNERDAVLVPKHDIRALAAAMSRVSIESELRERLARSARSAAAKHTPGAYYQSIAGVFQRAIG